MGTAAPESIGRHVHPQAHADATTGTGQASAARSSGIDYLALVDQRVAAATRRRIAYAELTDADPAAAHARDGHHDAKEAR